MDAMQVRPIESISIFPGGSTNETRDRDNWLGRCGNDAFCLRHAHIGAIERSFEWIPLAQHPLGRRIHHQQWLEWRLSFRLYQRDLGRHRSLRCRGSFAGE